MRRAELAEAAAVWTEEAERRRLWACGDGVQAGESVGACRQTPRELELVWAKLHAGEMKYSYAETTQRENVVLAIKAKLCGR